MSTLPLSCPVCGRQLNLGVGQCPQCGLRPVRLWELIPPPVLAAAIILLWLAFYAAVLTLALVT